MTKQFLVIPYNDSDLDGVSCAFGYAELLRKQGNDAVACMQGKVIQEVSFVQDFLEIPSLIAFDDVYSSEKSVVIVDTTDKCSVPEDISVEQVVELIDHRELNFADNFPNAKVQIELVGAAATLVAERFFSANVSPSKEAATLLYSAILSNTLNFKSSVLTDRDTKMADWLLQFCSLPDNYIHLFFEAKSMLSGSLYDTIRSDYYFMEFSGKRVGIGQWEMLRVESFVNKYLQELLVVLARIKQEDGLYSIFFSGVDIEQGKNWFVLGDTEVKEVLEKDFGASFNRVVGVSEKLFLRKQLWPKIKPFVESLN